MMGASPSTQVTELYDASTNRYFSPVCPGQFSRLNAEQYETLPLAVFDSGMLLQHPYIRNRVIANVDFTGEGPGDSNGHGTMVTLLCLAHTPTKNLINVKILDAHGRGKEQWLIDGLDWIASWAATHRKLTFANISAGIFHRRLGLFKCNAQCALAAALERAVHARVVVSLAAGNSGPNRIPCPQLAVLRGLVAALVVQECAVDTREPMAYSGPGNFKAATPACAWHQCEGN